MNSLSARHVEIALRCDSAGTVLEVVQGVAGADAHDWKGRCLVDLVLKSMRDDAALFIHKLAHNGMSFGVDLSLRDLEGELRFAGAPVDDVLLIVAVSMPTDPTRLFEAWVRATAETASGWKNLSKSSVRGRVLRTDKGVDLRDELLQEMTRLNEALSSSQRELAERYDRLERATSEQSQRAGSLELLQEATTAVITTLDLDALRSRIVESCLRAIPAASAALFMQRRPRSHTLEVCAERGFEDARTVGMLFDGSDKCFAEAARTMKPLLCPDLAPLPTLASTPTDFSQARSAVVVPMGQGPAGVVVLISKRAGAFDRGAIWLLEAFAIRAGMALGNALLHADLDRLAVTDALTGTYNQRGFVDLGKREFDRARRYGHPLGLISFTVDRLTLINDTHGRAVGDQVLAELGARCRRLLRSSDIVARPGRDEFCILVVETDPAGTAIVADRLRSRLAAESIATDAGPVAITVSVGTAGFDGSNKDFSMLLSRAGEAMSEASRRAGNKVVAWNGA